jgi:hypothetical protein
LSTDSQTVHNISEETTDFSLERHMALNTGQLLRVNLSTGKAQGAGAGLRDKRYEVKFIIILKEQGD